MTNRESVLSFDGKDDYVSLPEMNIDYSQGFTVEAWVLYHSFNYWSRIIDFGNGPENNNIVFANATKTKDLAIVVKNNGKDNRIWSGVLEAGVWMHLAATIDKSGNATLYKNGEVVKTGPVHLPIQVNRTLNYIGKSNWSQDGYFHGQMTELRLWNIARSQADIQTDKKSRLNGDETGLVGYWPLNQVSGNTVADKTSNGNHGTIHGDATLDPQICFKPQAPKTFLIKSKLNGLALVGNPYYDAKTGTVASNNPSQQWTITSDGVIKNQQGFVLDYQDYGMAPYYVVMVNPMQGENGSPSQQWKIEDGVIKNKHNENLVMDIAGGSSAPNTTILAAPYNGGLNQQWELV